MKVKILATASVLALLANPALAEADRKQTNLQDDNPRNVVSKAAEDVSNAAGDAYRDVKAFFSDEGEDGKIDTVTIDPRMTASGMIGQPVNNHKDERIGTVKDIILTQDGTASMIIVADGEFPGFDGKLAAFKYSAITRRNPDGDVILPLTVDMIDDAVEFSYDRNDKSETVQVIGDNGHSAEELLEADLLDPERECVATIEDIGFRNGKADQLIVMFNQIMGVGGERAAIRFNEAKMIRNGNDIDFQLSANQVARFEAYKENRSN